MHVSGRLAAIALFVLFAASSVSAQERTSRNADIPVRDASVPQQNALFLNPGSRLLLPGFREYDDFAQERSDSIILFNSMLVDGSLEAEEGVDRSMLADARIAAFTLQLGAGAAGGNTSFAEAVARFLLKQAIQFGYQYARERIRAQSLSEMDYLALPQGPGVMRNFNEVGFEARLRGEEQSSRVWRDYLESRKNRIPSEK